MVTIKAHHARGPEETVFYMPPVVSAGPASRRRPDRLFAVQLHEQSVPLDVAENALALAVAWRLARAADAPPPDVIRSLAYFAPVIEEVRQTRPSPQYFHHLRQRIQKITAAR